MRRRDDFLAGGEFGMGRRRDMVRLLCWTGLAARGSKRFDGRQTA